MTETTRHRLRTRRSHKSAPKVPEKQQPLSTNETKRWTLTTCFLAAIVLSLRSGVDVNYERRLLREEMATPVTTSVTSAVTETPSERMADTTTIETEEDETAFEISPVEIEESQALNRLLVEGLDPQEIEGLTKVPEVDIENIQESPSSQPKQSSQLNNSYESLISNSQPLPHYTLVKLLSQISAYSHTFVILLYDPEPDTFYALYSKKHYWASSNEKLIKALSSITYLIRRVYPEKIGEGKELALGISSGDYPAVKIGECVRVRSGVATGSERRLGQKKGGVDQGCGGENAAPILHFGSTFRHLVFPNMISMPMPEPHHLKCYEQWSTNHAVCSARKRLSRIGENGLFQDPHTSESKRFDYSTAMWDSLIPQVIWRGTDFVYLQTLYPELGRPSLDSQITPHQDRVSTMEMKHQAMQGLSKSKAGLVPRWKGVLQTAEAEYQVQSYIETKGRNENEKRRMKEDMLPWCNVKFSHFVSSKGVKSKTRGSREYRNWERMDFPAVGESLGMEELAKYKYHIDLGGGGGTTWSGTIQKLALPGLLFHHITPTQDYIHKYMKPWKHYVPVAPDLRDLKDKFDWAEAHPNQAKTIAQAGTRLARYWSSERGMKELFVKDIEEPLRAVMDAYIPVSRTEHAGKTWRKVIMGMEGEGMMLPILKCTGKSDHSCERMVGKGGFMILPKYDGWRMVTREYRVL